MLRKVVITSFSVVLFLIVTFGITYYKHPILLKWLTGDARVIGKPIKAIVYVNGEINSGISVYKVNRHWNGQKTISYLIGLKEDNKAAELIFINIDLVEKWIGRPACTNITCYDLVNGRLFQSETGGHFSPFQDDMKGYNFDPSLTYSKDQIEFKIPPNLLKFDPIRIVL
jgi:hypothetical protein